MAGATEHFNAGIAASNENNYQLAIESFSKALKIAETLGEEGASIVNDCKKSLPKLHLYIGEDLAKAKKADESVVMLKKAVELAKLYGDAQVEASATALIPKVLLADASDYLDNDMYPEAVEAYKKAIAVESNNASSFLGLGMAYSKLNNELEAISAYTKAGELGAKEQADKLISTIYLKKAAAAFSAKNYVLSLESAEKSYSILKSPQASKIIGSSGFSLKKYDKAILGLTNYIAENPEMSSKEKLQVYYQVATSYETIKNNAKACEFYKKIPAADPTFGAFAASKVTTLCK